MAAKLVTHPATPERWDDLTALFGPRGASSGCWCMWPRQTAAEFRAGKGDANRRALRRQVDERPPGLLGYVDGAAVAWCAVAPRQELVRLERSRILQPVDDQPVWSIPCLFVAKAHRGQGLSAPMIDAAARWAKRQGARIVEAYPIDTTRAGHAASGASATTVAPAFAWWGLASAFARAGFVEVARRSDTRPIMRRTLR